MAITNYTWQTPSSWTSATVHTIAVTVPAGTTVILIGACFNSSGAGLPTTVSATFDGTTAPLVPSATVTRSTFNRIDVFRFFNPTTGISKNIVITTNVVSPVQIAVACISGGATDTDGNAWGTVAPATGASGTSPSVAASSATGDEVIDFVTGTYPNLDTLTVDASQTQQANVTQGTGATGITVAGSTEAGASSVTMSWTKNASNGGWAQLAIPVKAASTGQTVNATAAALALTIANPTVTPGAVTVAAAAVTLTLSISNPTVTIQGGGTGQLLEGRTVTWTSSTPSVVAAPASGVTDINGQVTPVLTLLAAGSTNLQAHCEGIDSNVVPITVTAPAAVATVAVTPTSLSGTVGGFDTLTAVVKDASNNILTGRTVSWATSNGAVAGWTSGVGQSKQVDYLSAGSANVQAWCEGIGSNVVGVTVNAPAVAVASVAVAPTTLSGQTGGTGTLTATPKDSGGNPLTGRTVNWAVSNGAILSATSPGGTTTVSYLTSGTATVTANCEGIDSNVVSVTVSTPGLYANLPAGYTMPATAVTLMNPPASGNYWIWQNTVTQWSASGYNPSGAIAPTGAPGGDPIGEVLFPVGYTQVGNAPGILGTHDLSGYAWTELYVCLIHQFSSNWVTHPTGINKVMFVNSSGGNIGQLVFLNYYNSQWSVARQNTNGDQNQYLVGTVAVGYWCRHEFQLIQNTGGLPNGVCRMWESVYNRSGAITSGPTLIANYTNVNWNATNHVWGNLSWNPVYGGNTSGTLGTQQYQWMNRIAYAGR